MFRKLAAALLVSAFFPAWVFAEAELKGTVVKVDKSENQLVVKTDKGEETLLLVSSTKGMGHAKEGAKVAIKYTEKDGTPKVIEIFPQPGGTVQVVPH